MKDYNKKPPLGLKPRRLHEEQRVNEILLAISRYKMNEKKVSKEWIDELTSLVC